MGIESFYSPKLTTLPASWKTSSWTGIGVFWILSSEWLSPADCKIRSITDQGSLKDSIQTARINLFDREVKPVASKCKLLLSSTLLAVKRAVSVIGVFTLVSPFGIIWHSVHCIHYRALSSQACRKGYFKEHARSLKWDLVFTGLIYTTIYDLFKAKVSVWTNVSSPGLITSEVQRFAILGRFLFFISVGCIFILSVFEPKSLGSFLDVSFELKQKFGLVGEGGWLLAFNAASDAPTVTPVPGSNYVKISGYFCDLRDEQATLALVELRQILQLLRLELTQEQLVVVSEHPERLLIHLDQIIKGSGAIISCNRDKLNQSLDQARKAIANCRLIKSFLSEFLNPQIELSLFPFSPESCRAFLINDRKNPQVQIHLDQFNDLLGDIKQVALKEGGPNQEFIQIKKRILRAEDAYQVLGLERGASKEVCKKTYITNVVHIHPDKVSAEWQKQGAELFAVIDTAYKYLDKTFEN